MQNAHGYAWECRAPSHDPIMFEQEVEFQEHSHNEHGVPKAHVGTLSGAARRPVLKKILECPFGDDFSATEKAESNTIFSNEALHLHVAAHMKEIALLALQKLTGDDDGKSEDVASDVPLEDHGFAKLRGSMYSVLDDEVLDFRDEAEARVSEILKEGTNSTDRQDLEDTDEAGMTKLQRAVQDKNLPLAKSLIEQGANLSSRANHGKTALHYASLNEDLEMMVLLLTNETRDIMSLQDDHGQTPLHYAAKKHFTGGIELLAYNGISINNLDNYGLSPYHWAVIAGHSSAAKTLLDLGVDINSTSADGRSALDWAASLGRSSITELLVEKGANIMSTNLEGAQMAPLEEAAACGDLSTVRLLLDHGVDPNYRDREGWSAIHWAAEEGHVDIVDLLLMLGADVNVVSYSGTSPLHCAANGGHVRVVTELVRRGADPLESTRQGWTPLHHAVFMGHSTVVQFLLQIDRIATSVFQDNDGWSILHLAVLSKDLDTLKFLLDGYIISESRLQCDDRNLAAEEWLDLNFDSQLYQTISKMAFDRSRCCRAVTNLRLAVFNNNIDMTELLLEQGYSVNDTDSGRMTALYYAARKSHIPILEMLLFWGADPNILPVGLRAWENFTSDETVLQRLRQAGYKRPIPDPKINRQIRLVLRHQEERFPRYRQASQRSLSESSQEPEEIIVRRTRRDHHPKNSKRSSSQEEIIVPRTRRDDHPKMRSSSEELEEMIIPR